jgi:hypothetical protein
MIEIANFMKHFNLSKLSIFSTFALGNKCNFYESDTFDVLKGEKLYKVRFSCETKSDFFMPLWKQIVLESKLGVNKISKLM